MVFLIFHGFLFWIDVTFLHFIRFVFCSVVTRILWNLVRLSPPRVARQLEDGDPRLETAVDVVDDVVLVDARPPEVVCAEMISTKNTNAEATKLVVESISNNRGLNTLTCMNEYESKLTITNVLSRHVQLLSANDGVPEVGGLDPLLDLLELHGEIRVSASVSDHQGTEECCLHSTEQNCYSW